MKVGLVNKNLYNFLGSKTEKFRLILIQINKKEFSLKIVHSTEMMYLEFYSLKGIIFTVFRRKPFQI